MLLIGRAMSPLLLPRWYSFHHLVAEATGSQQFQMGRQDLVNRVIGNETNRGNFDHSAPGFSPIRLWQTNRKQLPVLVPRRRHLTNSVNEWQTRWLGHILNGNRSLVLNDGPLNRRLMRL